MTEHGYIFCDRGECWKPAAACVAKSCVRRCKEFKEAYGVKVRDRKSKREKAQ